MAFGLKDRRSGAGRSVAHGKTGGHANLRTIGRKTGVPSDRPDRPAISRKINKRRKIQDSVYGRPFIFSPLKSRSGTCYRRRKDPTDAPPTLLFEKNSSKISPCFYNCVICPFQKMAIKHLLFKEVSFLCRDVCIRSFVRLNMW
ncbi:MAG: hypothetical protein CW346_09090 [Bacillaceae bacterium]|nr:hypothetical protein [Bacillaceae bacterium]MBY6272353.1 hypothetical protein [Bacillaceae bacterium]